MITNSARDEILARVRSALGRQQGSPPQPLPASARVASRRAGEPNSELEMLLAEIGKLGGVTRQLHSARGVSAALRELVEAETIRKAMVWETPELDKLVVLLSNTLFVGFSTTDRGLPLVSVVSVLIQSPLSCNSQAMLFP